MDKPQGPGFTGKYCRTSGIKKVAVMHLGCNDAGSHLPERSLRTLSLDRRWRGVVRGLRLHVCMVQES
jgi:hypothetical protein